MSKVKKVCSDVRFDKECPICLTCDDPLYLISCKHWIHLSCARSMTSLTCPLCRSDITNFPEDITDDIKVHSKKYRDELEAEDLRAYLETNDDDLEEIVERPSAQMEIYAAIRFARSEGIPLSFIPTNVRVVTDSETLSPPGMIFQSVLNHIMDTVSAGFGDIINPECSDPASDYSDDSDDEDPFEMENENLSILARTVTAHIR